MSNGRYMSIERCVVANGSDNWISVPIFINPSPSDKISSFPEVLSSGEKAVYKEVLCSDYANYFFRKALDGKKNNRFRKNMELIRLFELDTALQLKAKLADFIL
ncbi:hypothetical protein OIU84_021475 [Salix udensis]|uniref:Uncharacterized protein n=1 Tax=Salix udensis TaxID=889485 RepID=A0AAD6PIA8_9ROSI|nr:hypothetical protein OIU84_021475 [Salix udensis]